MNQDRADAGAPPLVWRNDLAGFAEEHSGRMAAEGRIWHNDEYFSAESRRRFAAKTVGENVALNKSIDDAHRRLMNSPGHRANILNAKFTEVGVGVVKDGNGDHFITEAFVEPNGARPAAAPTSPKAAGPATPASASSPRPVPAKSAGATTPIRPADATNAAATPVPASPAAEGEVVDGGAEVGLEPQVLGRSSSEEAHAPSPTGTESNPSQHAGNGPKLSIVVAAALTLSAALAALVRSARSRRVPAPAFAASTPAV